MTEKQALRCTQPGAVSRDDLLAYARGEAGAEIREHVARCASCGLQATAYARTEIALSEHLFRRTCPPSEMLGEFVLGMLAPADARPVAEHLLECPHCTEERRRLTAFMAEPDETPQPAALGVMLRRLFARPVANRPRALALRRGAQPATTSYTADGFALTLGRQISALDRSPVVVGLLLGEGAPTEGAAVALYAGAQLFRSATVDDLGNFVLNDVPAGEYRLEFRLADTLIVVDPLRVT
jgi:hypothetical protein